MKIYYNLTKINNGWMLKRPDISGHAFLVTGHTEEEYFKTLEEGLKAVKGIQVGVDELLKL